MLSSQVNAQKKLEPFLDRCSSEGCTESVGLFERGEYMAEKKSKAESKLRERLMIRALSKDFNVTGM